MTTPRPILRALVEMFGLARVQREVEALAQGKPEEPPKRERELTRAEVHEKTWARIKRAGYG